MAGSEGDRQSTMERLRSLSQMISTTQKANPVQAPYAAGTPTLATNQLLEQARQNAEELALNKRQMSLSESAATVPDTKVTMAAVRTAAIGSAQNLWDQHLAELDFGSGQIPDVKESEAWIQKTLPGLKAGIQNQLINYGGTTKDADSLGLDIENFLRSKAGLQITLPDTTNPAMTEAGIRSQLGLPQR